MSGHNNSFALSNGRQNMSLASMGNTVVSGGALKKDFLDTKASMPSNLYGVADGT